MYKILFIFILTLSAPASADAPVEMLSAQGNLPLTKLQVQVTFSAGEVSTRLEMDFSNPHDGVLEGRLVFAMPADAAPGSFRIVEAVPLREQAPAEAPPAAGGFSERVLIDKTQHIVLSYSQPLPRRIYYFPLRGLADTDISLAVAGSDKLQAPPPGFVWDAGEDKILRWHGETAAQDLTAALKQPASPPPRPKPAAKELADIQNKTAELTATRDTLRNMLDSNQRISATNRELQAELEQTRAQLQAVEDQLMEMLKAQTRVLDSLQEQLFPEKK